MKQRKEEELENKIKSIDKKKSEILNNMNAE